jgi:hypothetical protein
MRETAIAAALAAIVLAAPAWAAQAPSVSPVVQSVIDCRKIDEASARLACFDKAVAGLEASEAKGDLVSLDREQRRSARRQAFGLSLPSLSFLDRGERTDEVNRLTTSVTGLSRASDGKWVITVEGGAVWRQIDDNEFSREPRIGAVAKIRKAALGSFFMNIDRQQAIRVHRVN